MITHDSTGRPLMVGDLVRCDKGYYSKKGYHLLVSMGEKSIKTVFLEPAAPPIIKHVSFVNTLFKLDIPSVLALNNPLAISLEDVLIRFRNDEFKEAKEIRRRAERRPPGPLPRAAAFELG